ncbi:hypothetical protein DSM104329_00661 [Capillimicrobium parvum]|uniref:Uncharacterized protein n=1 Tax=Capillimicrobium parvum TaxID=2884022 RepID=A0A9E6XU96_9ACTN|nr:hypothetical protein DSM104329_00661 [Capillimicrobium parvum]
MPGVNDPLYRLVCVPAVLDDAPPGWTTAMLREGEMALQVDDGGLEAIDAVAHALDLVAVSVLRAERTPAEQERTVIAYAGSLPLVWVAGTFSDQARDWARERGPMTLLVEAARPLSEDDRHRVDRFVALLGRQAE